MTRVKPLAEWVVRDDDNLPWRLTIRAYRAVAGVELTCALEPLPDPGGLPPEAIQGDDPGDER